MNRLFLALVIGILTASCATGADWSKPTLTDTYANFLTYLDARLDEVAHQFSQSTPINQPIGTIRWGSGTARWEQWNGSTWLPLAAIYGINVDSVDGYHVSTTGASMTIPVTTNAATFMPHTGLTMRHRTYSINGLSQIYADQSKGMFIGTKTGGLTIGYGVEPSSNLAGYNVTLVNYGYAGWLSVSPAGLVRYRADGISAGQYLDSATTPSYSIWDAGNDGAGSGLDADLLDGQHASAFRGATQKIAGDTVQRVSTTMGSYLTGTALVPRDNTIPQNTEGTQVMTRAITPTSAGNTLAVEATVMVGSAGVNTMICSLFRSDSANALAVSMASLGGADWVATVPIQWSGTANTTSAVTFSVRCGPVLAGTIYINGTSGTGALFNGTAATAIRVAEIQN